MPCQWWQGKRKQQAKAFHYNTMRKEDTSLKQYECDIHIRQRVTVEANSEKEARSAALSQYEAMTGIEKAAVLHVDAMEIARPTAMFGSSGRGVIF